MSRNILLVVRPAAGGIRSHIITLIRWLDRSQFSIAVAAPSTFLENLPQDMPEFEAIQVPITSKPSLLDISLAARIAKIAHGTKSIVHAHGIRAGFVAALAESLRQFPLITTYHNLTPSGKLAQTAIGFINSRSQAIITVSQAIANQLTAPNIHVIPNGIDLAHFRNLNSDEARAKLRIDSNPFVVGCVARLSPEKGVDILLRTADLLPNVQFIIAGDGPERDRLRVMAPANARLLGYVADVRTIYAASDVIAVPSRMEGQGIVALEAMASGTAVVATRVGGLIETIQDGVTGLLVETESPVALAEAIKSMGNMSESEQRKSVAKKWVLTNCDVKNRTRELEIVYESSYI